MPIDQSAFVSEAVIVKKVKLGDGKEHELYFRELPAIELRRFAMMETSEDDEKKLASMFNIIAKSLCEPDGSLALTIEQASKLNIASAMSIMGAIFEVSGNGVGK